MDRKLNIFSITLPSQSGEDVIKKNFFNKIKNKKTFLISLFQMNMKTGKEWIDAGNGVMADDFLEAAINVSYH